MPIEDKGDNYFGLADLLKLCVMWYFRIPVTEAKLHGEIGSCTTSVQWYRYFREICRVAESHDEEKVGGSEDVVEVQHH